MERITKEKCVVKDGQACHTVSSECKDGRSMGNKMEDAKNAFKTGPEDLAQVTKESHKVEGGRASHEYKSELKDSRGLADKLVDAKDAYQGKR